jgi:anti-sigma factor ChrR (cupin superfamily)
MTFKTDKTADLSVFFNTDEFAESVTYKGAAIDAIVTYGQDPNAAGSSRRAEATLMVKQSDVAAPAYRDTVVIGTTTWYVQNVQQGDDDVWLITLYSDERHATR